MANMPEEVFDRVIAVNLRGVYLGMKYSLPYMAKLGGTSVINQSSAAGLVGIRGSAAYCASKACLIALTKVAALEYARYRIRVNCICPGLINTPMSQKLLGGAHTRPTRASFYLPRRIDALPASGKDLMQTLPTIGRLPTDPPGVALRLDASVTGPRAWVGTNNLLIGLRMPIGLFVVAG